MYTLDASVWMREVMPGDPAYATCHALLEAIQTRNIELYEPWLLLAEVSGPVSRLLRDPMRGRLYADIVRTFPNSQFVALDEVLGREAAELAADRALRGADAVYAVIARRYGCTLVSLDNEHHQRLHGIVPVMTPTAALAELIAAHPDQQ
ncbi:MAG: type II toxin-antitoxin system VapC family toxin [Chloroflexaceae bacterium]|nr:type II toxin-antitoxin system VapC family toxin [Chloroflexaceae bacterium]